MLLVVCLIPGLFTHVGCKCYIVERVLKAIMNGKILANYTKREPSREADSVFVKKFLAFYGARNPTAMFTRFRH
jgi:hypothetical protein